MPRRCRAAAARARDRLGFALVFLGFFLAFLQRADRRSRAVRQRRATAGRFFLDAGVDPCAGDDEPLSPEDGSPLEPGAITVPGRSWSCPAVTSTTLAGLATVPSRRLS